MGVIFSTPVQTGSGAHPDSCTTGAGSYPAVKHPGRGADTPHPHLQCRGLKVGRAIPLPALRALVACMGRTFTFTVLFIEAGTYFCVFKRGVFGKYIDQSQEWYEKVWELSAKLA